MGGGDRLLTRDLASFGQQRRIESLERRPRRGLGENNPGSEQNQNYRKQLSWHGRLHWARPGRITRPKLIPYRTFSAPRSSTSNRSAIWSMLRPSSIVEENAGRRRGGGERATMPGMDTERTMQFILETQARIVADHERYQAEHARLHVEHAAEHKTLLGMIRGLLDIQRQAEEDRRRADDEHRQEHRRIDDHFGILIKMMDEWIRERRNNNPPHQ